jgi:hypothetical protein
MSKHQGGSDALHKVTLPSAIQTVRWGAQSSEVGSEVPLEVWTLFVGDGQEVKAEVRSRAGKTLGKASGKIGAGRWIGGFLLPDKSEGEAYFEAEIQKCGLKARSELLTVFPKRGISNAKWDKSEAGRGDVVKLTADTEGFQDGTHAKLTIFEHDAGGAHDPVTELDVEIEKGKIEAEWRYDYHDKTVEIPAHDESQAGYKHPEFLFRVAAGTASAESGLLKFKDSIEIVLTDDAGKPMAGANFVLHLADGSEKRGKLDGDGKATEKDLPPGPVRVEFPDYPDVGWEA